MKIRHGFVSNSSSSSFTCQVSGQTESGWDAGLDDVGMVECVNGHTFLDEYIVGSESDAREESEEYPYELPVRFCPICQMEHVTDDDMNAYLMKKHGANPEVVKAEIRATFADYDALRDYLKGRG